MSTNRTAPRGAPQLVPVMPLITEGEIAIVRQLAEVFVTSQSFRDAESVEQAMAKILLGRDLGLSPTQAMTSLNLIDGHLEVAAVTLGAFVRRTKGHDFLPVEHTNEACEIKFTVGKTERGTSRFTMEDGERAELLGAGPNGETSINLKYPRAFLWARSMSQGVRWLVPECTGGVPVYYEGEISLAGHRRVINGDTPDRSTPQDRSVRETLRRVLGAEHPLQAEALADLMIAENAVTPNRWSQSTVELQVGGGQPVEKLLELATRIEADIARGRLAADERAAAAAQVLSDAAEAEESGSADYSAAGAEF